MKYNKDTKHNLMLQVEHNLTKDVENYLEKFPPGVNDEIKSTAFLFACRSGKLEIAKLLLEYVTPNYRYSDGQTALMLVSQLGVEIRGIMDFVDLLVIKGCEVDLVDFCGKSALHWATIKNVLWAVRTLISYRCNINSVDLHGFTPLMYAAKMNFGAIVSLLLHSGADPSKNSKQHGTAIHQAVRCNSCAALKQLIPFYRHLNILDTRNQSPIDLAVMFDNFEIVTILLHSKKEIEVNRRPSFAPFRTPLEQACQKNNIKIANELLIAGADVNYPLEFAFELEKQNARSSPVAPLMFAVINQNLDLLHLLLSNGADVNIQCPKAPGYAVIMSPVTLAAELGNKEMLHILENRMSPVALGRIGDTFTAACCNHDVNLVMDLMKSYDISIGQHLLKNGVPVILELFRDTINSSAINETLLDIFSMSKKKIIEILNPDIALTLSRKCFGSSMQFYRCAWLKLAEKYPSFLWKISGDSEKIYVEFIISFLDCFFLGMKNEDFDLLNLNFELLDVFPHRLIRLAIHSTTVVKSILLSKSFYAIAILVDMHFNEQLVFWDNEYSQPLDVCEFALFFDNLDAALILNLSCGLSLKCINEYDTWPYVPEIMNQSLEYNESDKISALKYLSKNVKSLKTLCKYAIKRYVPSGSQVDNLSGLSASLIRDLTMDLSGYICDLETGLHPLCKWASVDTDAMNICYF